MIDFDRGMLGREFDRTVFPPVTKAAILEYAAACGEVNPLYTDETLAAQGPCGTLIAPPTFPLRFRGYRLSISKGLPPLGRTSFDAAKDIELGEPVRPGDVLTASSAIHDIYEKTGRSGSMRFLVVRTTVTNQENQMVAIIDQRKMFR